MAEVYDKLLFTYFQLEIISFNLFCSIDICQGMRDESNLVNMTSVEDDAGALYEAGIIVFTLKLNYFQKIHLISK